MSKRNEIAIGGVASAIRDIVEMVVYTDVVRAQKQAQARHLLAEAVKAEAEADKAAAEAAKVRAETSNQQLELLTKAVNLLVQGGLPEPHARRLLMEGAARLLGVAEDVESLRRYIADGTILSVDVASGS